MKTLKLLKFAGLAVLVGSVGFSALADSQWYAKPDGADDADCTDPATAGSISAAMAKAAAADGASVITLADGDYDIAALTPVKENNSSAFFVVKKDLTLVSAGGDPANCRLIGGGEENRSRFLLIPSAASIALTGITVSNFWDSASDAVNYRGGGAIFANGTSVALTISNCVFSDNHTRRPAWESGISGGAINGGTLDITDTSFVGNMAITGSDETGSGGAFCSGSIVQLKDCLFMGNNSSSRGGAIYFNGGSAVPVERCTFVGNGSPTAPGMPSLHRVNYYYGVIYANGSYTLKNCTFRENVHEIWGAGHMFGVSGSGNAVSCYDCTFEANQAMNLCGDGSIVLRRCRFTGNTFKQMNANAPTLIESCLFSGTRFSESTAYFGTGPYYNCTFVGNKCNNGSVFSANAQLINCIVTADNHVSATASFTASHCIWNANGKGNLVGEGNITDLANDAAIKFVGLGDDPYALMVDSPARDKGDNALGYTAVDRDLVGGSRLVRALDIGAYEYQIAAFEAEIETQVFDGVNGCEPHPVVTDAETETVLTEGTDYTLSWSNNEQTGMGTMRVTGVNGYAGKTANIDFKIVSQYGDGQTFFAEAGGSDDADCVNWATAGSISAAMAKAAAAQGAAIVAFADGDYDIGALTPVTENNSTSFFITKKDLTLVSAGGDPAKCRFIGGGEEGTRGRFLLVSAPAGSVTLKGVTVTNFWDSTADTGLKGGGAVLVNGTTISLSVTNCVFADNHIWRSEWTSGVSGGAINGGALDITDSSFIGNTAITGHDETGAGGAIYGKIVRLENCRFERNAASSRGGAVYASAAIDAPIKDCTFDNNDTSAGMPTRRASNYYGVIYVNGGFALENCMFCGNKMNAWLASMIGADGAIDCHDCTFADNTTMYVFGSGNVSVSRCRFTTNRFLAFNAKTPVLNENCLFVGNSFTERQHYFGVGPYHNCTFVGNTALNVSGANGGVFSNGAKLINCIVTADNQVNPTAASYTYYATNCVWNASGKDLLVGEGNNTDLADDAAIKFVGTGDDPYAIQKNSPARDKGANVLGYTKKDRDLAGNPRLSFDGLLDIGCYEYLKTPGLMLLLR